MLKRFLTRSIVNGVSLWVCVTLLAGLHFTSATFPGVSFLEGTPGLVLSYILAGAVFAFINAVIRPILVLLALPLYIVTLGLFFVIVNGVVVMLASALTTTLGFGISVDNFLWAIIAGVCIGIVNTLIDIVLPRDYQ